MRVSMAAIIHRARWNFNVDEADGVSRRDTASTSSRRRSCRASSSCTGSTESPWSRRAHRLCLTCCSNQHLRPTVSFQRSPPATIDAGRPQG